MKKLLWIGIILLLLAQLGYAQDEDKPSVLFLAYSDIGSVPPSGAIMVGLADALESYGFINPEDRPEARGREFLDDPENSAILFSSMSANRQIDLVRGMVSAALDQEPDVLVTVSTPVTWAALNATSDMEEPPAIFFADVYSVHESGIAEADCIKPSHITGEESINRYDEIVDLLLLQAPGIKTIGTLYNSSDAAGAYGALQIAELGASFGLTVEQTAVTSLADLAFATEGLINKGVEAILLPLDNTVISGQPIIINTAYDADIPVFSSAIQGMREGATVTASFVRHYEQGERIGSLVAGYLNGELDIATTSISRQSVDVTGVFVNMLAADNLNLDISEALAARADIFLTQDDNQAADDYAAVAVNPVSQIAGASLRQIFAGAPKSLAARAELDRAFFASLECSPERIAEQQAELDARDG